MKVTIIDYGLGNIGSVFRSFVACNALVTVSSDPVQIANSTHLVLPGVGSFRDGMANLRDKGLDTAITKAVQRQIPLLGICLGMQLLADNGEEGGLSPGLGLIPGQVKHLIPHSSEKIPHIGWNEVKQLQPNQLLSSIPNSADFYFDHSYYFNPLHKTDIICHTPYCGSFVSVIGKNRVFGVQFHPEKSQHWGFQLIRNFISID